MILSKRIASINTANKQKTARKNRIAFRKLACAVFLILVMGFVTFTPVKQAQARCCYCCIAPLQMAIHAAFIGVVIPAQNAEFDTLREQLLAKAWWHTGVGPLAKSMTTELVTNGWSQLSVFGAMLDGMILNERILDLQIISAKAAKRHIPSVSMCKFATLNKSLAQSDQRARMVRDVLGEFSLRRAVGQAETIGATETKDLASRLKSSLEKHCDNKEFGKEMSFVCPAGANSAGNTTKDINFTNAIDVPDVINISLDMAIVDNEVGNILAMKQMLYSPKANPRIGKTDISSNSDGKQSRYAKWRSTLAKKTVAENSFDALIGMKSVSGIAVNNQYRMQLASLGMPNNDINAITKTAPSYWAQMEHLTKKIYQNTDFFVNLYDNPNNVLRQSTSMEAISLMQMRDYYNSLIRSEMALSVLLDTEVGKSIDALNNTLNQWGY